MCGELGPGDGEDPRYDRDGTRKDKGERKTWQLCKQVATTVQLSLDGADDSRLRSILVLAVEPAPDASHLRLLVAPKPDAAHEAEELRERLETARGRLRQEVAHAITRRRAPELTVSWVPIPIAPSDDGSPEAMPPDEEAAR